MIFITFNPYDISTQDMINYEKKQNEKLCNECFVCFDYVNENNPTIKLKTQTFYTKLCLCDGYIHTHCLDHWYNIHKSCPICRVYMYKNSYYFVKILGKSDYLAFLYSYLIKQYKIKKICILILSLYFFLQYIIYNNFKSFWL